MNQAIEFLVGLRPIPLESPLHIIPNIIFDPNRSYQARYRLNNEFFASIIFIDGSYEVALFKNGHIYYDDIIGYDLVCKFSSQEIVAELSRLKNLINNFFYQ